MPRSRSRLAFLALALLLGCGEDRRPAAEPMAAAEPSVAPEPALPEEEPPDEHPPEGEPPDEDPGRIPSPPCASDDECVVIDVPCVMTRAVHRSVADEVREAAARLGADISCRRAPHAAPAILETTCAERACALTTITWPELRRCDAPSDACARVADPCEGELAVRATRRREARARLAERAYVERCRARRELEATLVEQLEDEAAPAAPPPPRCERGFCR